MKKRITLIVAVVFAAVLSSTFFSTDLGSIYLCDCFNSTTVFQACYNYCGYGGDGCMDWSCTGGICFAVCYWECELICGDGVRMKRKAFGFFCPGCF